jgi:hypothetical protein
VFERRHFDGLQIFWKLAFDFRADCAGTVAAFFVHAHGHDATGIDRDVWNADASGHMGVLGGDERGVVVRDETVGSGGEAIEDVVGALARGTEAEDVSGSDAAKFGGSVRNAFENERMEAVICSFVIAGQAFVYEQREVVSVRDLRCVGQGVVLAGAPVHLRPIEDAAGGLARG